MLDYDISRCSRRCCLTGREIKPGELVHSALVQQGGDIVRQDFCTEAWTEAPAGSVGCWTTRIPEAPTSTNRMAPPSVLVQLFDQLSHSHDRPELRFVLALLMIRKRLLRQDHVAESATREHWVLKCALNGETYEIDVLTVDAEKTERLQNELVELLYGDAVLEFDDSSSAPDS